MGPTTYLLSELARIGDVGVITAGFIESEDEHENKRQAGGLEFRNEELASPAEDRRQKALSQAKNGA